MKIICLPSFGNRFWRKTKPKQQQRPQEQVIFGKDIAEDGYSEEERAANYERPQHPEYQHHRRPIPQSTFHRDARATSDDQGTDPHPPIVAPQPATPVHDPQGRETLHNAGLNRQIRHVARDLGVPAAINPTLRNENPNKPGGTSGHGDGDTAAAASSGAQDLAPQSSFQPNPSRLSHTFSQKLKEEIGRKLADKDPKPKFEALSNECRNLIRQLMRNPSKNVGDELEHPETYINTRCLQDVLTQTRLHELCSLLPGEKIRWIDPLYDHFPCTIAILLLIGWKRWDRFHELFYSQRDRFQNFTRCDSQLPFWNRENLAFLDDETTQQAFYTRQFLFKPHVFIETRGEPNDTVSYLTSRLPFLSKACIYNGERPIHKVKVDVGCIQRINPFTESLKPNLEPELYAMKVFKTEESFRKEMGAHSDMKKAPFKINHAVVSVTAFKHKEKWCSLYPWADQNLMELFNGKCPDYGSQVEGRFRPQFVLEQLEGLVCALKLLHHDLDTRHFDIKPDNILVYNLQQGKCGVWKLTDFGLSRDKRPELRVVSRSAYRDERSSVPAPRGSGPYQPPEMRPEHTVNSQSDMFSIGAVMLVAWVFLIGGPDAVKAFREARSRGCPDDVLFETQDGRLVLKPEVDRWQATPFVPADYAASHWAKVLLGCVQRLLNVERSERPGAMTIYQELKDIHLAAKGYEQLWSYEPNFATVITENALQPGTSVRGPSIFDQRDLRITELQAPRFAKLKTVDTFSARLSPHWVIFIASHRAYGYRLHKLLRCPEQWREEGSHAIQSVTAPFIDSSRDQWDFKTRPDAAFDSACIGGDYLALIRRTVTSAGDKRNVEFYNLDTRCSRMHDLPADCIDVIVSVKGVLAFVFDDRIEAKLSHGLSEKIPNADANEKIQQAAFSHDGDYLCVWYTLADEMRWRIFRCEVASSSMESKADAKGKSAERQSFAFIGWRYVRHTTPPKSFTLRSTTKGQNFFACGEDGRFWFINCEDCEQVDPHERLREDAPTMQHNEGNIDLTMPLFPGTLAVLQRHRDNRGIRLWGFTRLESLNEEFYHRVKIIQNWNLWPSTTLDTIGDAQMVDLDGAEAILVVHKSGILELRLLRSR